MTGLRLVIQMGTVMVKPMVTDSLMVTAKVMLMVIMMHLDSAMVRQREIHWVKQRDLHWAMPMGLQRGTLMVKHLHWGFETVKPKVMLMVKH